MASQASSKSKSSSAMSSGGDTAPPARANQRTILDDIILTFSSPMAWLLVVALVITWTAVAVVLFDLLDYKTLAASNYGHLHTLTYSTDNFFPGSPTSPCHRQARFEGQRRRPPNKVPHQRGGPATGEHRLVGDDVDVCGRLGGPG
uniref:uncharacterized protein LOC131107248 isoform X2 n=1 Tax=Doryrhamphus excisus TaxID=161450 RepID=UPI0025AE4612|nr:uncharacterized protein LOC131107248 isoform X2 [Doryrhamphus excisus]